MGERDWRPFIYGGLASIIAEFGTFPIDTTKTRLQIQGQKFDSQHMHLKYTGMTNALIQITKQEGLKALYSGIWPAVLRQATYGTIKFGTYYSLKQSINEYRGVSDLQESIGLNALCAATAGALSSAIANPTDVLKVRMQVHGKGAEKNLIRCFYDIYLHEGMRGLWMGVGPTAQRAGIIAAVELPVYDSCKRYLTTIIGDNVNNHFVSSFVASLGSAIASTPLDVVRTRLMNQKKIKQHTCVNSSLYNGTIDCFMKTIRNEGFMALYKGFIPTWFRMGPWNIIFFITYEQLKKLY